MTQPLLFPTMMKMRWTTLIWNIWWWSWLVVICWNNKLYKKITGLHNGTKLNALAYANCLTRCPVKQSDASCGSQVTGWVIRAYIHVSKHPEMQTRLKWVSTLYIFCQNEADFKHHENSQESRPKSKHGRLRQRLRSSCLVPMQENS